jgi:uncharacterized protein YecT (DUF1311 family)
MLKMFTSSMISMLNSQGQDKEWERKFTAMEAVLILNARQAEKERDALRIQLECSDGAPYKKTSKVEAEVDNDMNASYQQLFEENNQLKNSLLYLKDQCAWQTELEQVQNKYSNKIAVNVSSRTNVFPLHRNYVDRKFPT